VRVYNELGEVHCTLTVAPAIRPGTVQPAQGSLAAVSTRKQRDRHGRSCPTR